MSGRLVLAVRAANLPAVLRGSSFVPLDEDRILSVLAQAELWLGPRSVLEHDESYRQIIPYIVLSSGDHVLRYRRTVSGSERRLHDRFSIGVGGHIDLGDLAITDGGLDLRATIEAAALREMKEEVGDVEFLTRRWVGLLADDTSPVGRVHLGVVGLWTVRHAAVPSTEQAIGDARFVAVDDLDATSRDLETWSDILRPQLRRLLSKDENVSGKLQIYDVD